MVTQTKFHNQSDCRQHYWFITACACAIPVLLQLCESSFEGLKCIVYSLPMNILQPCHPCPFWLISLIIHYSFTRPLLWIFMICAWHTKTVSGIKTRTNSENDTINRPCLGDLAQFSISLRMKQQAQESSWGRYISHGLLCWNMSSNCPAALQLLFLHLRG